MKSNTRFNTYPTFGNFLDNDAHATDNNTSSAIQNGRKIHLPETAQTRTVARKNNTNLVLDSIFYLNFVSDLFNRMKLFNKISDFFRMSFHLYFSATNIVI